mgnify:CR=1 FL=1
MITIDGSYGEGGGQILRTALALACILNKDIKIINIRVKRENPGLRPQHFLVVKALKEITNANVEGLHIGSKEIYFKPSTIRSGNYYFDVGTAGSITLILQSLLPVLVFGDKPTKLVIKGGTAVPKSPTFSYFSQVFCSYLTKMGVLANFKLLRHGFYPKGGGLIEVEIFPSKISPLNLLQLGEPKLVRCEAYSEGLPQHVVEREVNTAISLLKNSNFDMNKVEILKRSLSLEESQGNIGNYFIIICYGSLDTVIGYDKIGMRGLPAEKVAEEPTKLLIENIFLTNAPVDYFAGDQLLIWLSLCKGTSKIRVHKLSLHAFTNLYILREMLDIKYEIEGGLEKESIITITGNPL